MFATVLCLLFYSIFVTKMLKTERFPSSSIKAVSCNIHLSGTCFGQTKECIVLSVLGLMDLIGEQ